MKETTFIGQEHGFDLCNQIALEHISPKLRHLEPGLYTSKWFDYRQMNPTTATYLFVHHYNLAYGDYLAAAIDRKMRFTKAIKGGDLFFPKRRVKVGKGKSATYVYETLPGGHLNRVAFWKLRQRADRCGMRYDFFCRAAFKHFEDAGWANNLPRPAHCDDDVIGLEILDRWDAELKAKIQWATNDFYRVENFTGHPDQIAYEQWIIDAILKKPVKAYALHAALYERDAIRIETALANFGSDDIDRAVTLASE